MDQIEVRVAFEAATEASLLCAKIRAETGSINVMTKSDASPVTRKSH